MFFRDFRAAPGSYSQGDHGHRLDLDRVALVKVVAVVAVVDTGLGGSFQVTRTWRRRQVLLSLAPSSYVASAGAINQTFHKTVSRGNLIFTSAARGGSRFVRALFHYGRCHLAEKSYQKMLPESQHRYYPRASRAAGLSQDSSSVDFPSPAGTLSPPPRRRSGFRPCSAAAARDVLIAAH